MDVVIYRTIYEASIHPNAVHYNIVTMQPSFSRTLYSLVWFPTIILNGLPNTASTYKWLSSYILMRWKLQAEAVK